MVLKSLLFREETSEGPIWSMFGAENLSQYLGKADKLEEKFVWDLFKPDVFAAEMSIILGEKRMW